jgi:zinc/manganese transport system substrate-binding protein
MRSLCLIAGTLALVSPAAGELRVVAATNDIGAIAKAVGGDHVEIDVVARPDRDPHAFEVRPSTLRAAARADAYLEVGLSLDLWSADVVRGSRNRKLVVIDCSQAIEPRDVPVGKVDASMGDIHPDGNPHYWLNPRNGAAVARFLAGRFAAIDSEHAADYDGGAQRFAAAINERWAVWESRLADRSFVEHHRTWVYLAAVFGMEIVGRVEPQPGIPPSARHLADLSELIRERSVPVVVRDAYHSEVALEFLARETGVRTAVLPSSCNEPDPAAYLAMFDRAAAVLGRPAREPATEEQVR